MGTRPKKGRQSKQSACIHIFSCVQRSIDRWSQTVLGHRIWEDTTVSWFWPWLRWNNVGGATVERTRCRNAALTSSPCCVLPQVGTMYALDTLHEPNDVYSQFVRSVNFSFSFPLLSSSCLIFLFFLLFAVLLCSLFSSLLFSSLYFLVSIISFHFFSLLLLLFSRCFHYCFSFFFYLAIELSLTYVCVVIGTTHKIYVVDFSGWQAV